MQHAVIRPLNSACTCVPQAFIIGCPDQDACIHARIFFISTISIIDSVERHHIIQEMRDPASIINHGNHDTCSPNAGTPAISATMLTQYTIAVTIIIITATTTHNHAHPHHHHHHHNHHATIIMIVTITIITAPKPTPPGQSLLPRDDR